MKNTWFVSAVTVSLMGLVACGGSQPAAPAPAAEADSAAKKAPAGPPEPVTAKTAFYAMYTPARMWATDLVAISLVAGDVPGVKNADGKFGMWTAVFGSPSLRSARTYTYAVAESLPTIYKGVKAEGTDAWAGPTTKVMPFQNSDFTVDSDAAYKTAAEKAGSWLKENPDKPLVFTLGNATRFPAPVWYIMWGDTKNGYAVFVNATTGNVLQGKK